MKDLFEKFEKKSLSPAEKRTLVEALYNHLKCNQLKINSKVPREAFDEFIDELISLFYKYAEYYTNNDTPVRKFLNDNNPPKELKQYLPNKFRAICLMLNGIKQWLSKEQTNSDKFILGAGYKKLLKEGFKTCIVTNTPINSSSKFEFHHILRDGTPPIPLTPDGHRKIEGISQNSNSIVKGGENFRHEIHQSSKTNILSVNIPEEKYSDIVHKRISPIKQNGHYSWVQLRKQLNTSIQVGVVKGSFAIKAIEASGLTAVELLEWLNKFEAK